MKVNSRFEIGEAGFAYHAICHVKIPWLQTHMQAHGDFRPHSNQGAQQYFRASILKPWKPIKNINTVRYVNKLKEKSYIKLNFFTNKDKILILYLC